MKPQGKESINIDADIAQQLRKVKADTGTPIYELIRQAWALYIEKLRIVNSGGSTAISVDPIKSFEYDKSHVARVRAHADSAAESIRRAIAELLTLQRGIQGEHGATGAGQQPTDQPGQPSEDAAAIEANAADIKNAGAALRRFLAYEKRISERTATLEAGTKPPDRKPSGRKSGNG